MQIILNPRQFDVILTENLFGDILSDEASVITGSIGLLASASLGTNNALFEPIHGSYPQAKGKNIANRSLYLVCSDVITFGLHDEAKKIYDGVEVAIGYGVVTTDLNPDSKYGTNEIGEFISNFILNKDDLMYFNSGNYNYNQHFFLKKMDTFNFSN
jgi:3-isopropylmalate dehydrogenase